jgi:hypothetical protein
MKTKAYSVKVIKRMYVMGVITVDAKSFPSAIKKAQQQIAKGELQTTAATWFEPTYEDDSFDVDEDVANVAKKTVEDAYMRLYLNEKSRASIDD